MKKMLFALSLLGVTAGLLGREIVTTASVILQIKNPNQKGLIFPDNSKAISDKKIDKKVTTGKEYIIKVGSVKKTPLFVTLKPNKSNYTLTINSAKDVNYNSTLMTVKNKKGNTL